MAKPNQFLDKNDLISGFYSVGLAYSLTDEQSVIFDENDITAIVIVTAAGCSYSVGTNPDATPVLHDAPAGAYPLTILAGEKIYISGTAKISVVA
jgi:hypothetical protein